MNTEHEKLIEVLRKRDHNWLTAITAMTQAAAAIESLTREVAEKDRRIADLEAVESMRDKEIAYLREQHGNLLLEVGAKQAQIDRLMLEYCPDEMTDEQMEEWRKHQRPVSTEIEAQIQAIVEEARTPTAENVIDLSQAKRLITQLRGQLAAQAAAEPVGTIMDNGAWANYIEWQACVRDLPAGTKLYAGHPPTPQQEPLTKPDGLHSDTYALVIGFAQALLDKLRRAEEKYGYSDGWMSNDWMDECRAKLVEHVAKGDPRDVAAYCAFLWHHSESTVRAIESASQQSDAKDAARYRWLEENAEIRFNEAQWFPTASGQRIHSHYPTAQELGNAVDAAMTANTQELTKANYTKPLQANTQGRE